MATEISDAIRASDADRDKALALLRDHWLAGRLTLEEYEARCDEAAGGRFLADLERALRELPYPLPEHVPAAPPPGPAPAPAVSPDLSPAPSSRSSSAPCRWPASCSPWACCSC